MESVEGLKVRDGGTYVDATFGGGGHSKEILNRLGDGKLFAFDKDKEAERNLPNDDRIELIQEDFRHMKRFLRLHNIRKVDGIIADLGVSSHQFNQAERGFSFRFEADLDMRMNNQGGLSGVDVVNDYSEEDLADVLFNYGEIRSSRKFSKAIVQARPLKTTTSLKEALMPFLGKKPNQVLAQVFQAIRIEVNQELDGLIEMLESAKVLLNDSARIAVISYHSLEDRLVKNFFRSGNAKGEVQKDFFGNNLCEFKAVNRKVIIPADQELEQNPRSRSAKLRIAERI